VDGTEARVVSPEGRPFAIPVPAGAHEVVLAYRPLSFRLGLACAALALAGLLLGQRLLPP
jgi:uncharacterized membrane protein YfhO